MKRITPIGLVVLLAACGPRQPPAKLDLPRPVTVIELDDRAPLRPVSVAGSVAAWRQDDVAFEVSGRIVSMVQQGTLLRGQWREGGEVKQQGQVIARIDPEPYRIARDNAKANLEVAQRELAAAQVRLDKVLPAQLTAAKAQVVRAEAEFQRNKEARERNAVSEVDLIRATADRDTRLANQAEIEANVAQQEAQIDSLRAQVLQAQEAVNQAEFDLGNCVLYAPFDGEVAELYSVAGGFARKGEPVAQLVMMDPVNIDVAVSAEQAASVSIGDTVNVFLPGDAEPSQGAVFEKSSVADQETRTFRISVFCRNWRHIPGVAPDDPRMKLPRIERFQELARQEARSGTGPVLVEEKRALRRDAEGEFVWVFEGVRHGDAIRSGMVIPMRKARVKTTDHVFNVQGIMTFRGLESPGDMTPGDVIAWDVPDGFEGKEVLMAEQQWKLRPGQVVTAVLDRYVPPLGHWVPLRALQTTDDRNGTVYVVQEAVVRVVPVRLTNKIGDMFRVEPVDEAGKQLVRTGASLVVDYVHFLADGERVKITQTRELAK
ncbi:MAG: HlyD family efflux transporter periplasmic adaptor subunit [Planctomycetota bacterium]